MGEKWFILVIVFITALIIGGAIFFVGGSSQKAVLGKTAGAKIGIPEKSFDFKNIPYSGGNAVHKFTIKNTGDKELLIANLKTSCTCTKAYFQSDKERSQEFSMHATSDWTGKLDPGKEGIIVSDFDPTAHGPQGVGPITRLVSFETNDPDNPYVELSFKGVVVK